MRSLVATAGRVGVIVPTGIATDDTTKDFFADIVKQRSLVSLFDFENRDGIFTGVHRSYKFSLLTLTGANSSIDSASFAFFCHEVADLDEDGRRFNLSPEDLALLNPNTRTCPVFRSRRDAEITKAIYKRVPVFVRNGDPEGNPWGIRFRQGLFNMTSDSDLFRSITECERAGAVLDGNVYRHADGRVWLPLYEAKMVSFFDHRAADVVLSAQAVARQRQPHYLSIEEHRDPARPAQPLAWIDRNEVEARLTDWHHNWLLGFCDITSSTNERTVVPAVIPRSAVGNNLPLLLSDRGNRSVALLGASFASLAIDFAARQKVGGNHLNFFLVEQFPVLPPEAYDKPTPWDTDRTLSEWLSPRVLELTYTAWDLAGFASDLGYDGPPFLWDEERRRLLRAELDACFFHLYGINRDTVEYILGTFPIVARHDLADFGEFRTKNLILDRYDAMARAAAARTRYDCLLDPPPADRRATTVAEALTLRPISPA